MIVAVAIISIALTVHFRLSETERSEIESGDEKKEKESAGQIANEIVNSLQNKPNSEQNENKEQTETTLQSYVKTIDGVQVVTIDATEFKFIPSEINIKTGNTKFVIVNKGEGEHELVAYESSKKDLVDKAEQAHDEETILKNILFEVDDIKAGESKESNIINLKQGSYVFGCHVPGHYEAGMKGTLTIK